MPRSEANRKSQVANKKPPAALGRLQFAAPVAPKSETPKREARKKIKNDPKLVAAARELRDRWLERVNKTPLLAVGKYDVTRALPSTRDPAKREMPIESPARAQPTPLLPPLAA